MVEKIFFAGDFLVTKETNKEKIISDELQKKINQCNIVCCNFEGPVVLHDIKAKKKVGPNLKNNDINTKKLIKSKFNLFCLANNHIFDYGEQGIQDTIDYLRNNGVDYIGAGTEKKDIYNVYKKTVAGNIKIGIINVAENGFGAAIEEDTYGYAYMFNKTVFENIKKLKREVDIIIIVVHAGAEHWNVPLPEIRELYKKYIDLGANVIIGHHPHVPQGIEEYKNGLIAYSLGNFAFDMGNGAQNNHTYSIIIEIEDNKKINYEIVPTMFKNEIIDIDNTENNVTRDELIQNNYILTDNKKYIKIVDQKCLETYKYYQQSYARIFCIYKGNLKERIKGFIKKVILKEKFQNIWLYHNINIETHLWICKRASRLLLKEKKIL